MIQIETVFTPQIAVGGGRFNKKGKIIHAYSCGWADPDACTIVSDGSGMVNSGPDRGQLCSFPETQEFRRKNIRKRT